MAVLSTRTVANVLPTRVMNASGAIMQSLPIAPFTRSRRTEFASVTRLKSRRKNAVNLRRCSRLFRVTTLRIRPAMQSRGDSHRRAELQALDQQVEIANVKFDDL